VEKKYRDVGLLFVLEKYGFSVLRLLQEKFWRLSKGLSQAVIRRTD